MIKPSWCDCEKATDHEVGCHILYQGLASESCCKTCEAFKLNREVNVMSNEETKNLVIAVMDLGIAIRKRFGDGIQADDFPKIIADMAMDQHFRDAFMNITKLPGEVVQLSIVEICDLVATVIKMIPSLVSPQQ